MEFEDIAKKAFKKEKIDEFEDLPTKYAYLQLEKLYYLYSKGAISKEKSTKEKNAIKKEFEANEMEFKRDAEIYHEYNNNRVKNAQYIISIEKATKEEDILKESLKFIQNIIHDSSFYYRNISKLNLN